MASCSDPYAFGKLRTAELLAEIKNALSIYAPHPYAATTVSAIATLFHHDEELARYPQNAVNRRIVELTGSHPEGDFISGTQPAHRLASLAHKVDTLLGAYVRAKEQALLPEFFAQAFDTDPCLNGRLDGISKFNVVSLLGLPGNIMDADPISPRKGLFFLNAMEHFVEGNDGGHPPDRDELKDFLTSRLHTYAEDEKQWILGDDFDLFYLKSREAFLPGSSPDHHDHH